MIIVGFDIGGTKSEVSFIEFDLKSDSFKVLIQKRIPTNRHRDYEEILNSLSDLFQEALNDTEMSLDKIESIGIGMPGTIHPKTFMMLNGNSSVFIDKNISKDLKEKLGFKKSIHCENDANCFAYAEARFGAGKEFNKPFKDQVSVGVILGTGCGGGIIAHGNILRGHHGGGGGDWPR